MATIVDILTHTDAFFEMHWPKNSAVSMPSWKTNWSWSGSVPYHDKGGVYALIDGDGEVVYIGLGASRGGGLYKDHGISRRLLAHVIKTCKEKGRGHYEPRQKWAEVWDIGAVGFPREFAYLAPALEDYLIWKVAPSRNSAKKAG